MVHLMAQGCCPLIGRHSPPWQQGTVSDSPVALGVEVGRPALSHGPQSEPWGHGITPFLPLSFLCSQFYGDRSDPRSIPQLFSPPLSLTERPYLSFEQREAVRVPGRPTLPGLDHGPPGEPLSQPHGPKPRPGLVSGQVALSEGRTLGREELRMPHAHGCSLWGQKWLQPSASPQGALSSGPLFLGRIADCPVGLRETRRKERVQLPPGARETPRTLGSSTRRTRAIQGSLGVCPWCGQG